MPYTKDSKERPRNEQITDPRLPGELTLAYTMACLEYIAQTKNDYAHMARCMAVLDVDEDHSPAIVKGHLNTLRKLRQHIAYLTSYYISKNLKSDFDIDVRASRICAQQEWYWKMMRKYEDRKCYRNGEVYPRETEEPLDDEMNRDIEEAIQAVRKIERDKLEAKAAKLFNKPLAPDLLICHPEDAKIAQKIIQAEIKKDKKSRKRRKK